MMIVVIIIALLMGGIGLSIGASSRVQLRTSCVMIMSAIRYAFSRAITQGTTVRLVLDFESRTIHIEETKGRVVLNRSDETGEGLRRSEQEEQERLEAEEQRNGFLNLRGGSASSSNSLDSTNSQSSTLPIAPGFGALGGLGDDSSFENLALDETFFASLAETYQGNPMGYKPPTFNPLPGKRGKERKLEGDTVFTRVFTSHETVPRENGRAYLYFFPNGLGQHSFIQLSDGTSRIYTIETHPLSGKSFFYNEEIEPSEDLDELEDAEL